MSYSPDSIVSRDALSDILARMGAQLLRSNGPFYVYENRLTTMPFIIEWDKWGFTWDEAMLIVTNNDFDPAEFEKLYQAEYGFTAGGE